MTAEWVTVLIDVSLKATVLLLSACVMALLLRRAPAATRHLVWSVALAGVVVMPAISHVAPAVQVPVSADSRLAYVAVQETATPPVPVAPKLWVECNDPASDNPTLSADGTLPAST